MAPLLGDWEDMKLKETTLDWKPTPLIKRLLYYIRYGSWYRFTTNYYNENWFNMNDHIEIIKEMQLHGLSFQIREAADKSFERVFVKFIAGSQVDLTAMQLMK